MAASNSAVVTPFFMFLFPIMKGVSFAAALRRSSGCGAGIAGFAIALPFGFVNFEGALVVIVDDAAKTIVYLTKDRSQTGHIRGSVEYGRKHRTAALEVTASQYIPQFD
jgi:hypothetical protein